MKTQPISSQQLDQAIDIIVDCIKAEGLEFWRTIIKGDDYKPLRWVSTDALRRLVQLYQDGEINKEDK